MPLDPISGSLIASALSAIFGIGNTVAANKYNSPRAMRNRLRKAGLPLAYMYQGKVMGQSEVPKLSIDPTLGVPQQRKLEQDQPLIDENVGIAKEKKDNLQKTNQILDQFAGYYRPDGTQWNIRATRILSEIDEKRAAAFLRQNQGKFAELTNKTLEILTDEGIPAEIKRQELQKIKQQLTNLAAQAGLMEQLKNIRSYEEFMNKTFNESIDSLPKWSQAILSWLSKIFRPVNL